MLHNTQILTGTTTAGTYNRSLETQLPNKFTEIADAGICSTSVLKRKCSYNFTEISNAGIYREYHGNSLD